MRRRDMDYWQISNARARKLRRKGVVVYFISDRRLGYRGMARNNPMLPGRFGS